LQQGILTSTKHDGGVRVGAGVTGAGVTGAGVTGAGVTGAGVGGAPTGVGAGVTGTRVGGVVGSTGGSTVLKLYISVPSQGTPAGGSALAVTVVVKVLSTQKSTVSVSGTLTKNPGRINVGTTSSIKSTVESPRVRWSSVISMLTPPTFSSWYM